MSKPIVPQMPFVWPEPHVSSGVGSYLYENRDLVIGGVITVLANDIVMPSDSSALYTLSHPRFLEIRRDKREADTLPHIINQLEAAQAGKATT